MKGSIEIQAEMIIEKLTLEELRQAAKIGIMMMLMTVTKTAKIIKDYTKENPNGQ